MISSFYLSILQNVFGFAFWSAVAYWLISRWGPFVVVQPGEVIVQVRARKNISTLTSGMNLTFPLLDSFKSVQWSYDKGVQDDIHQNQYRKVREAIDIYRIPVKSQQLTFCPTDVISQDNHWVNYTAAVFFTISDPATAVFYKGDLYRDLQKLVEERMKKLIGSMDCDKIGPEVLTKLLNNSLSGQSWKEWGLSEVESDVFSIVLQPEVVEELREIRGLERKRKMEKEKEQHLLSMIEIETEREKVEFHKMNDSIVSGLSKYKVFASQNGFTQSETVSFLSTIAKELIRRDTARNM